MQLLQAEMPLVGWEQRCFGKMRDYHLIALS